MTGSSIIAEDQREGQQEILEQRSAAVIAGIEAIDPDHVLHLASSTLKIVLSHFIDGPGARPGRRVFAMPREEEGVAIAAGLELAGARPVLIFQKISPSDSACTFADVQSAGFGLSATAAAPSPLPLAPWQDTQLTSATFLPAATVAASAGNGFFLSLSAAGATHAPWARANAGRPRPVTTAIASATATAHLVAWIMSNPPQPQPCCAPSHHS